MSAQQLLERYYFSQPGFVNGTAHFHQLCQRFVPKGQPILEIGSGPPNRTSQLLAGIGPVTGVDIGDEIRSNHWLTESHIYDGVKLPLPDAKFAACVSDFVLEHVEHPAEHFREVGRVLVPGGVYCFRTPNLWHYVTLGSRLLPFAGHLALANRLRARDETAHDPYPTFYRANSARAIRNMAKLGGLAIQHMELIEKEPSYGQAHPLLFYPMMAYERLVNSTEKLAPFRINLFAVLRKLN